ncbi:hypothetical protein JCM8097_008204 [Rhodosporidiobolus ruineniae]
MSTPSSLSPTPPAPPPADERTQLLRTASAAQRSLRSHRLSHPQPSPTPTPSRTSPPPLSRTGSASSTPPTSLDPSPSPLGQLARTNRPRSIRSIASYGALDSLVSPSPSPSSTPPSLGPASPSSSKPPSSRRARLRSNLRSRLLCLVIAVLLAVCVYASFVDDFMGDVEAAISCATCIGLLAPLKALANVGDDAFVETFVGFCTKLGIEDEDVCLGAVGSQAPILAHDLRSIALASPAAKSFCSTVFGLCPLQKTREHTVQLTAAPERAVGEEEWEAVMAGRERVRVERAKKGRRSGEEGEKEPARVRRRWESKGRPPFKVVHISDVHVDREYTEGAATDCSKVICCREYGPHSVGEGVLHPAGKFGHKKCDAPPALVDSMFGAIEQYAGDRAFTIFTGDVVESAVWAVEEENVSEDLRLWHEDLRVRHANSTPAVVAASQGLLVAPRRKKVPPSYPAFGNHDIAPVNAFPRSSPSSPSVPTAAQWVFDLTARDWARWIGREAAEQVRTKSGCWSRVHEGTRLKVVSVNTGYWYKQNFWLYDSDIPVWDPNGILTWLAEELDQAERDGLRVWIIGHMPPGKVDAMRDQSNYLNQILQRYHTTIAAHFYGHSHVDEFEVDYSDYKNRTAEKANGVAFIGGAVTPTSGNPVFRVYDVDPDTYEVMDFTPYYANKTSPTYQNSPDWKPYYSARQSYNSWLDPPHPDEASLNATFWHRVTEVFEKNETAFQLFNTRLSRGGKIEDCSGPICRQHTVCMLRSMRSEDNCAVIQPGLSFKDQKRDTDAVTEPQRDEEADPSDLVTLQSPSLDLYSLRQLSLSPASSFTSNTSSALPISALGVHAPDHPEERFAQSRHHDFFACEGPGLGSLLRKLGSGVGVLSEEEGVWVEGMDGTRREKVQRRREPDFSALRAFQAHVDSAVKHHHRRLRRERFLSSFLRR